MKTSEEMATEIAHLKLELADVRFQRDRLLEMTWLDLPAEPCESTVKWKAEFEKGWVRR